MQNYLNSNTLEIYFETYGCTANYNSSEIMKGVVSSAGLNITSDLKFADVVVINSCIVKSATQEKIRGRLSDLMSEFPEKKFILTGCMPRLLKDKFQKENLFLLDTSHIKDIGKLISDIFEDNYSQEIYLEPRKECKANLPKISDEKLIGIAQISEGCLGRCTYCITRLAKGKLYSYPEKDILNSVKRDVEAGCKEIWLTSQDNASYGLDSGKNNYELPGLLRNILKIPGKFYVRLGMSNPNNVLKILEELIEIYKNPKMFKFLHIPVQSGSDKILEDMERGYTRTDVLKIVEKFRREIPGMMFSTDVILSYPTENEKDFEETLDLFKKINPEILNKSNFCPRPFTQAAKLGELNTKTIKERATKVDVLHLDICKEIQKPFIGKTLKVLIDKKGWKGTWLGRAENYKLVAVLSNEKNLLGKSVDVKITGSSPHYLVGVVEGKE